MPKPLRVYLFNVGQGDHILIQLPNGEYGIIDSHYDTKLNPLREPPGLTFLKERKTKKEEIRIAFLHISHYHRDHLKGLEQWLCWMKCEDISLDRLWLPSVWNNKEMISQVKTILDREQIHPTVRRFVQEKPEYRSYLSDLCNKYLGSPLYHLEKLRSTPRDCRDFDVEYLDGQADITPLSREVGQVDTFCLAPLKERMMEFVRMNIFEMLESLLAERHSPAFDQNNISNILVFRFADFTLLFGGDAKKESIEECIEEFRKKHRHEKWGFDLACDFIKCFHHGSKSSTSPLIWTALLKDKESVIIAISAGDNKKYNHPNKQTIEELHQIADKNNIELKLFTTKKHNLLDISPYVLSDTNDTIRLPWPSVGGEVLRHQGEKNARLNSISFSKNEKLELFNQNLSDNEVNFLGYRFDFMINKGAVEVKKLIAT